MKIKLLILLISLKFYLLDTSNVKISRLFGQTPEEQCTDFECTVVKSVNYYTSCGRSTNCENCKLSTFKPVDQICSTWKSSKFDQLQLASGSIYTNNKISGQVFENLSADWDSSDPIDITKCQIENFDYNKAYGAFSSGKYTALYSTITFHVSIITNIFKKKKKKIPSIEFQLELDETLEELNARNMNNRIKREKSLCPISRLLTPLKMKQKKIKGELTIINRSFSIPLDKSEIYRPYEFRVKVKCKEKSNCDMSIYKFCLKITCSRMPEGQIAEYKIVQDLINNPPPVINLHQEENEEENEEEDKSEKTEESSEKLDNPNTENKNIGIQKKMGRVINKNYKEKNSIIVLDNKRSSVDIVSNKQIYIIAGVGIFILLIILGCFIFMNR